MSYKDKLCPLQPNRMYHIYNRAVGKEKLFIETGNYLYFLLKMKKYILPVADIWAYCLIPNHFHLLVQVKSDEDLINHFTALKKCSFCPQENDISDFVMQQFSNWLNSYAKAFNKRYSRKGGLFIDYTKRSEAINDSSISAFIFYIHKNPVHHGLTNKIGQWPYDSYQSILSSNPTSLKRDAVIEWFGSKENFIMFHSQPVDLKTL